MECIAYIGLGSNLGDRAGTLLSALRMLAATPGVAVRKASQFFQTAPAGGVNGQGKYLNGAAEIATSLAPAELLRALHRQSDGRRSSSLPQPCPQQSFRFPLPLAQLCRQCLRSLPPAS